MCQSRSQEVRRPEFTITIVVLTVCLYIYIYETRCYIDINECNQNIYNFFLCCIYSELELEISSHDTILSSYALTISPKTLIKRRRLDNSHILQHIILFVFF